MISSYYSLPCLRLLCLMVGVACTPRDRASEESRRRVEVVAIQWLGRDEILFRRLERRGERDVWETTCDNAGIYVTDLDGRLKPWSTDRSICEVLRATDELSIRPVEREVLFSEKDRGVMHRLELVGHRDSVIALGCANVKTPVWSPEGQRFAFSGVCNASPKVRLYVANRDGREVTGLASGRAAWEQSNPSWSPDGQYLAFQEDSAAEVAVAVTSLVDGKQREIARGTLPCWSPTGHDIAYWTKASPARPTELHIVAPNGSHERSIRSTALSAILGDLQWPINAPCWSSDGALIVITTPQGIWTTTADGREVRHVVRAPTMD